MTQKLKTIVLDLDATLIHSREQQSRRRKNKADNDCYKGLKTLAKDNNDETFKNWYVMADDFIVVERPHCQKFLDYIFKEFDNVIVWTAASKDYAEFIIDRCILRNKSRQLSWYFFSYHCDLSEYKYGSSKDLKLLTTYFNLDDCDDSSICILDDYSDVANGNPGKCIIAEPFDSESDNSVKDDFLLKLMECFDKNMDVDSINSHLSD